MTSFWKRFLLIALCAGLALTLMMATASAASETLRFGDRGPEVRSLQQALNSLGYSVGSVDGKYGALTESAVRRFQRANGLYVDGVAGVKTRAAIYAAMALPTGVPGGATAAPAVTQGPSTISYFNGNYATLRRGSVGSRVRMLQAALNSLGFSCGSVDGTYGNGTFNAVVRFQSTYGLKVDGVAGILTLKKIESLLPGGTVPGGSPVPVVTPVPDPGVTPRPTATGIPAHLITPSPSPTAVPAGTAWTPPERTLRIGALGDDVASLQARLVELGWLGAEPDGNYSQLTATAVSAFQRASGINHDGVAGPLTYAALALPTAARAPLATIVPARTATPVPTASPVPTATPVPTPLPDWTPPTRTLRPGYTGSDVSSLQQRLKDLGWYTGSITGIYDDNTTIAVLNFQRASGLIADGIAGSKTYAALASPDAARAPVSTPTPTLVPSITPVPSEVGSLTLRKGMSGKEVAALQARLAKLDYQTTTYGTYDGKTAAAVKSFQQKNGLTADGVAGPLTLTKLYESNVVHGDYPAGIGENVGVMSGPALSQIKLLHWYNDIKDTLQAKQTMLVFDPATSLAWTVRIMSNGHHSDVEPLTATDTAIMYRAFGNMNDWGPKPVYVQLPSGVWTVAATHNVAHGSQTISSNNFNGQNCIHFLRDMSEAQANDPNYGVQNQNVIRDLWKALTGERLTY